MTSQSPSSEPEGGSSIAVGPQNGNGHSTGHDRPENTQPQENVVKTDIAHMGGSFGSLADLSIRRPVFAWMLMFGLIIFGSISFNRLGVSEQPDIDFPVLTINETWSGSAPEVMETEVADKIEEQVISTQGLRDISSQIQQGQVSITLEFEVGRNIDAALTEVQSKLEDVELPQGSDRPTIVKTNPEDQPILLFSVSSKTWDTHKLTEYVELNVLNPLKVVPGVGSVVLAGYQPRNLRVWVDNEKLKPLQLSILDVKNAIQNEHVEEAAGYIENSKNEFNVRTMGEGATPADLGNIQIKQRGAEQIYNSNIRIKDVAYIEDGLNDVQHVSISNGHRGLGIGIKKQHGTNSVGVAKAVKERLDELKKLLPPDVDIELNYDGTRFIQEAIHETLTTLILSAIVTSIICLLFLASFSATFNVLLSIPTSVMGTFIALYFLDFTLNFFTLLGLSLAIGIIVDDAIMVLENIVRHFQMGKTKVYASRDGAREVTFAALASTIAVMAIFLPVAFMTGIIGRFFFQFGITISVAVFLSLIEAITITPMRCSQFMARGGGAYSRWTDRQFERLAGAYRSILGVCLKNRWLVIFVAIGLFAFSLKVLSFLPQEFLPKQDQGSFLIRVTTPIDSAITLTEDRLVKAGNILNKHPEIDHFFSVIGGFTSDTGAADGPVTDGQINSGLIYVTLKPRAAFDPIFNWTSTLDGIEHPDKFRKADQFAIMNQLRNELNQVPDLQAVPQELSARDFIAGRGFPIELNLRGPEYPVLEAKSHEIIKALKDSGYLADIDTDFRTGMPEVQVVPNRAAATASGVTIDSIANTVETAIGGAVQGKFTNGDRRYDVRIRLQGEQRSNAADIMKLQVRTDYGELLPISSVVSVRQVPTYQTISRRMRERSVTIYANVAPGKSQSEALDRAEAIAKSLLPAGYRVFVGGGAATFRDTFQNLFLALWLGLIISYMVLASQFNSFVHPLAVLLALPFSLSGALLALYVTGQSINLYSLIGIILLMGIAKKNSILLVEFTNQKRFLENLPTRAALLAAAPVRLRPILMTSLATLAAAVPPALALGPGAESRIPMAITVIGGVIVSTLLTLIVVPCAYSLLARLEGNSERGLYEDDGL